jgi:glycosyltransferase involved in cell wall biosynthesis
VRCSPYEVEDIMNYPVAPDGSLAHLGLPCSREYVASQKAAAISGAQAAQGLGDESGDATGLLYCKLARSGEAAEDSFGVDSTVIAPPIETQRFCVSAEVDDYYLVLSRLVPYKRIDLAVHACNMSGRKLKIIGSGPDMERLREIAGSTVEFLGRQSDESVATLLSRCQALLFPGEEDFGMTPLEANAAGRPVIAFAGGGALETIIPGLNGSFFKEPTVDSLVAAMDQFEAMDWKPEAIRAHAETYDALVFHEKIHAFLDVSTTATVIQTEETPSGSARVPFKG